MQGRLPEDLFAINGRFFGQPVTGVQRYGREVVRALDGVLTTAGKGATVLTPMSAPEVPPMQSIRTRETGRGQGYLWEQGVLPFSRPGPLLNLCNMAPVLRSDQVVCIHDANVFMMPEAYSRGFRSLYIALQPLLARRSARITTVSRDAAAQLARHLPIRAAEITVLPNGHEHAFRWNPQASRIFDAVPQSRPFVLLLGSRARHKNAGLILGLAGVLDGLGVDLLVAGGGAGIFTAESQVDAPNVRRLGTVTDDDLALLLSRALCLAFPSFTEGFGLPIVEAMALGCPVVSSDRASMPEVCGEAALLAPPDDAQAWRTHFERLAASPDLRDDLRGRGREQVGEFSWTKTARGYVELLDRIH